MVSKRDKPWNHQRFDGIHIFEIYIPKRIRRTWNTISVKVIAARYNKRRFDLFSRYAELLRHFELTRSLLIRIIDTVSAPITDNKKI